MSRDIRLGMTATLDGQRAVQEARNTSRAVERESERASKETVRQAERSAQGQERAAQRGRTAAERQFQDRERLGIRSEQRIRREIALTEASYQRLARSGVLSANELGRAFEANRQRLATLHREMQAMARPGAFSKGVGALGAGLQGWQTAAGVAMASGYVISRPVTQNMAYDRRLVALANTAYAERDVDGRLEGAKSLGVTIREAVLKGGGNREQAADALDAMLASGLFPQPEDALKLLPTLQRDSTATGTPATDLAAIAMQALQFGIKVDEIPLALDMATKAGQLGGFEINDMSRWLPQQLAAAGAAGMKGLDDFGALLAANQAARRTAGTADEAGNNVVNFLQKLTSQDLANSAKRVQITPGKSIDLIGTLNAARAKGINPIDAFGGLVEKLMANNKEYQRLQANMKSASTPDEKKQISEAQATLIQGSVIGSLLADRQAWSGFLGFYGNKDYRKGIEGQLGDALGTNEANMAAIEQTSSFKMERAANVKQFAESDAFGGLAQTVGDVAGKLADYGEKYPALMASIVTVTTALNALAAAAGAAALLNAVRGAAGANAAARGAGAAAAAGSRWGQYGRAAGTGLVVGAAGLEMYSISHSDLPADQKAAAMTGTAFGAGGALAGARAGALAGSALGPWGTAAGAVAGGAFGGFLGKDLGDYLAENIIVKTTPEEMKSEMEKAPALATGGMDPAALQAAILANRSSQQVHVTVDVQNGEIVAHVKKELAREAGRN